MSDIKTKEKILDAAEKLFVDNGFSATSLRAIIKEAGVNTASVHYHFGSKEGLIDAVFERRVADMNWEREEMLDSLERRYGDRALPLEEVIRTFLLPVMRRHCAGGVEEAIPKLMGRAITESAYYHGAVRKAFGETVVRFEQAIARAMPGLGSEEIEWRLHMTIAVMLFTVFAPRIRPDGSDRYEWDRDHEEATERLVRFLAAGMRAPMREATGKETK
jgi:AcrR family transcriptional regulator